MGMGPLHGYRIVEMAGLGPAPFCAMLLSDMGADVVRIDREGGTNPLGLKVDVLNRGRRSVALNLREDLARAAHLVAVQALVPPPPRHPLAALAIPQR